MKKLYILASCLFVLFVFLSFKNYHVFSWITGLVCGIIGSVIYNRWIKNWEVLVDLLKGTENE